MRGATTGEAAADLVGHVKLSAREGSRSGDGFLWAAVARSFGVEQRERTFGAISCPSRHGPSFGFAQRLRRAHSEILPTRLAQVTGGSGDARTASPPTTSSI